MPSFQSRIFVCYTIVSPCEKSLYAEQEKFQLDNGRETFRRVLHKKVPSDFNKLTDKAGELPLLGIVYQFYVRNMVVENEKVGGYRSYRKLSAVVEKNMWAVVTVIQLLLLLWF